MAKEKRSRPSDAERLATLRETEQAAAARADRAAEKARAAKAARAALERRLDARRKIIVGGAMLARAERDPALAGFLRKVLAEDVTRDADRRDIADLLGLGGRKEEKSK